MSRAGAQVQGYGVTHRDLLFPHTLTALPRPGRTSPHVCITLRDKLNKGSTNLYPENDKTLLKVNNT